MKPTAMARWRLVLVSAATVVAVLVTVLAHVASATETPTDTTHPSTASTPTTVAPVVPIEPDPPATVHSDPAPTSLPQPSSAPDTPRPSVRPMVGADPCPAQHPGHWAGGWRSANPEFGGTIDQDLALTDGAISGTVRITGSVYAGGDVVGTLRCRDITLGFVIGVASFNGILSDDGLSASGTYTAPAINDHGTWSAHFVSAPTSGSEHPTAGPPA